MKKPPQEEIDKMIEDLTLYAKKCKHAKEIYEAGFNLSEIIIGGNFHPSLLKELRDVDKEFLKLKSMRASISARKREPKYVQPVPKIKKIRQKIYDRSKYETS